MLESPPKRHRPPDAPVPPALPDFVPEMEAGVEMGVQMEEERVPPPPPAFPLPPANDAAAEVADPALLEARAYARQLLRDPGWVQWAEATLTWCETHFLDDVEELFATAEDYASEETYRYMKLFYLHPGAAFAKELLLANEEKPLDLSKVAMHLHAFALICHNGACVIAAWLGVQCCTTTELSLETQNMICWCIE